MSNFQRSAETWILGGEIDQNTVSDILRARYETDVTKPVLFLIDTPGGLAHAKHPYTLGLLNCLPQLGADRHPLPTLDRQPAWAL